MSLSMPFAGNSPKQDDKISVSSGKGYLFSDFIQLKADGDEFFVEGVISSTSPDLGNDIVTERALNQLADIINSDAAAGKPRALGFEHTELLGGNPNLVPVGNFSKAWVEGGKLFAKASLNKALGIFKEVKSALERRDLHSFSIEYLPDSDQVSETFIDGVKHRVINAFKALIGIAATGRPMNVDSVMNFAAKNLDYSVLSLKKDVSEVDKMVEENAAPDKVVEEDKPEEVAPESEAEVAPEEKSVHADEKKKKKLKPGKKTVDVDEDRFAKFEAFEKKEAEVSEEGRMKGLFDKFYKEETAKMVPAGSPKLDGSSHDSVEVPVEVKEWQTAIDSGSSEMMFKAAGKLFDHIESKGHSLKKGNSQFHNLMSTGTDINQSAASNKFQLKTVELKAQLEHDADRITTGTEYFLTGVLLNDIFAPGIVTHLNEMHTTYGLLRKEDGAMFGDTYGFRFKHSRTGATANYDESATDDPSASVIGRNKAHIPFMWYRMVGQVSGPVMAAARGTGGIGDVLALEIRDQTEDLLFSINVDIFDSSGPADGMTNGGQIMSLRWLLDNADTHTTLYALTRTAGNFTTLQGNITAKSNTPEPTKDDLRLAWHTVVNLGANKADLMFITSTTQNRKIMNLFDDQQRINNNAPNSGFGGLPTFDTIPVHMDQNCDAGFIYLLDMRHTFLVVQLAPGIDELANLGDYRKFQIKTYFLLVGTAPTHNFLFTGFNTS